MALPKLTVMKHELSLPSTGEKITFRPFLVKEEKILMMAMQSGKTIDMVKALRQIIENCIESDIVSSDLPTFDIEYIFLQLRARSVGETIPINYSNKDGICEDGKNKCDFFVEINLDDITIEKDKNHKALIDITKDIKVKMKYPKVETTTNIAGVEGEKLVDATFDLIGESIEYIMDGEDIRNILNHGASAAQMGTAFLCCDEAGTSPTHKHFIMNQHDRETVYDQYFRDM